MHTHTYTHIHTHTHTHTYTHTLAKKYWPNEKVQIRWILMEYFMKSIFLAALLSMISPVLSVWLSFAFRFWHFQNSQIPSVIFRQWSKICIIIYKIMYFDLDFSFFNQHFGALTCSLCRYVTLIGLNLQQIYMSSFSIFLCFGISMKLLGLGLLVCWSVFKTKPSVLF